MSTCGGNSSCGSSCKCGNGCGCGMYPDVEKSTGTHVTIIEGIAPVKMYIEGSDETSFGAEGCKCGSSCQCDPCNCPKKKKACFQTKTAELKMGTEWFEPMALRRIPTRAWLGYQKSMGLMVGGNHTSSRRVVLRAFMLVVALIVVSLMQMAREVRVIEPIMSNFDECPFDSGSNSYPHPDFKPMGFLNSASSFAFPLYQASPVSYKENENMPRTVFKGLMEKNLLQSNAKALCVGEGSSASGVLALRELGFFDVFGVDRHPFFSLFKRRFVYEIDFKDNHFDFVFCGDLDKVSIPALLVMEIERVLRPGGTGAALVGTFKFHSGGLVKSFLKSSDVVYSCGIGPFTVVIFKKRLKNFEHFQLSENCPSIAKNKSFMKHIEPLGFEKEISYLPNYMNISSRNKLVYINVGAGEFARTSVAKMTKPYCSNHHAAFDVFVIDHRTSVLTSYVTGPGITFVYDPALAGDTSTPKMSPNKYVNESMDEEGFDFVRWFNETVVDGDFVVLMMNAKIVELNILVELFRTGAICRVDELFLGCPNEADCKANMCGDCKNLIGSLRKSGVYAHQWLGD
ncbi:hypothetical protein ACJIZ3_017926 [Penstemon smallii]|uniref:Metallothionein-like protein n=1 Tax=Penstemon smallii TaxID=265156 RepID=A0ABD3SWY5_9LAMI